MEIEEDGTNHSLESSLDGTKDSTSAVSAYGGDINFSNGPNTHARVLCPITAGPEGETFTVGAQISLQAPLVGNLNELEVVTESDQFNVVSSTRPTFAEALNLVTVNWAVTLESKGPAEGLLAMEFKYNATAATTFFSDAYRRVDEVIKAWGPSVHGTFTRLLYAAFAPVAILTIRRQWLTLAQGGTLSESRAVKGEQTYNCRSKNLIRIKF